MTNPYFTIILPNYKTEYFLEECLVSLKNQTFQDFQCLLINDGSPSIQNSELAEFGKSSIYENKYLSFKDNDLILCKNIFDKLVGNDQRFKYFEQENQGQSIARNTGLKNSTGQFVLFLDCDDYFRDDHLELIAKELSKYSDNNDYKQCIYYFKDYQEFEVNEGKIVYSDTNATEQRSKNNVNLNTNLVFNQIGTTYCATPIELFEKTKFRILCKTMEDVEIINRMFLFAQGSNANIKAKEIDITNSAFHRRHANSITTQDSKSGNKRESQDMINMYVDYLKNYKLTFTQKILCRLGILRFNIQPQKNIVSKYSRKVLTLLAKIISRWWS